MQQQQQQQSSSTSSPCSSSQSQSGMSHSGGGGGGGQQAQHHQSHHSHASDSVSLATHHLGQPYAAEASNFGPSLYHHHFSGHYNLHHPHLHPHPYNKAASTSPVAPQHAGSVAASTTGSGGSYSRSPSDVDNGSAMNTEYLGSYHHQGFYSSLHHHNMNIAGHHPYQHMVRSNGTYIDFVPR